MKKLLFLIAAVKCGTMLLNAGNTDPQVADYSHKANQKSLYFEENKGQIHNQNYKPRPDVLFAGQDGSMTFHLKSNGISYQLSRVESWKESEDPRTAHLPETFASPKRQVPDSTTIYRVDINWLNANPQAQVTKGNALSGYNNYYSATCPDGALNVRSYESVTYSNLYSGIDLMWYEKDGHLKYDYIVAPHADYRKIQLQFEGAERISINELGELVVETPLGNIIEAAPLVTQGSRILKSRWVVQNNKVNFSVDGINPNEKLVIDPAVRIWGTYYGSILDDIPSACICDATGNVYLSGTTCSSLAIATSGSHQSLLAGYNYDAFLVKFNSAGVRQWGTYYGGDGYEVGMCCATDGTNYVYLSGYSDSDSSGTAIATVGSHQDSVITGYENSFLVKFDASGVRQWGTFYGGESINYAACCVVDGFGNVYIAGGAKVGDTVIATSGCHQITHGGGQYDAYLAKFNSSGVRQWGTYYGGTGSDMVNSCVVDGSGNVYLAGKTSTPTGSAMATPSCHQSAYGGGLIDGFLVKFNASGVRQWGTYYGSTGHEDSYCAIDTSGNVYLSGFTTSASNIATSGSHQSVYGGGSYDAFLAKFSNSGVRQWSTYYGANNDDRGYACAVDSSGAVILVGSTKSMTSTAIATAGSHQVTFAGVCDAFVAKFNSAGLRQWGTYYGGNDDDAASICASDGSGNAYIVGLTFSNTGIATPGAHQPTRGGINDCFLVKFDRCVAVNTTLSSHTNATCYGNPNGSATVNASGGSGFTYSWAPTGGSLPTASGLSPGTYSCTVTNGCGSITMQTFSITQPPMLSSGCNASGIPCYGDSTTVAVGATGGTPSYAGTGSFTVVAGTYSYTVTDANGCTSTTTITVTQPPAITSSQTITICNGDSLIVGANVHYTSGTYSDVLAAVSGCDSTVTTNLTVNPAITSAQTFTICSGDSLIVGPNTYYNSGTYSDVFTGSNGCDSLVTSVLIVNPTAAFSQTISICNGDSVIIGSNVYNTSGTYTDVLAATNGCDSVVTTNLTVNPAIDVTYSVNTITITANQNGATYQWIDCNNGNQPIAGATSQSFTPTVNGNYAVIVTLNNCSDTSACEPVFSVGSSLSPVIHAVNVYPNPSATGDFILELEHAALVVVTDAQGRTVFAAQLAAGRSDLGLSELSDGIYFLMVEDAKGLAAEKLVISK
jgi:hypothetical protein